MPTETSKKGPCESCGKPRSLKRIDSGQMLCTTCRREFGLARTKEHATPARINKLREAGFDLSNYATKDDCRRCEAILNLRSQGISVSSDADQEECDRLYDVLTLRRHGVRVHENTSEEEIGRLLSSVKEEFHMGVAGEQFRQNIVKRLRVGESVRFVPEPNNPHDHNAIAITRNNGELIGYVKRDLNERFAQQMADCHIEAKIDKFYQNDSHTDVILMVHKYPYRQPGEAAESQDKKSSATSAAASAVTIAVGVVIAIVLLLILVLRFAT